MNARLTAEVGFNCPWSQDDSWHSGKLLEGVLIVEVERDQDVPW